jgi:membrane-associated protease RseP (regulator of RpoE activity)
LNNQLQQFSSATMEDVAALREQMAGIFEVDSYTLDRPAKGFVEFRGRFLFDVTDSFDRLHRNFETAGFTPQIREDEGGGIILTVMPIVFDPKPSNWTINLVLFIATVLSTLFIGAMGEVSDQGGELTFTAADLLLGLPYCLSILLILGAHEFGHYFAARYHKVPVTLPYFIPFPFSIIGTMGAFIQLKAPVKNRRELFDVGAAGPLAGLVFAIPILIYGIWVSPIEPLPGGT